MKRYIHFIGIGGIGMSGIAQILLRKGEKVSGSDLKDSPLLDNLRKIGARIYIGHNARNIQDQDLVVYSSAIKEDNPELIKAKRLKIQIMKRAEALAELAKGQTTVTVSGAHGKTTTSSLVSHILLEAGLSPTIVVGGIACNWDNNACLGDGKFFVIEADESDGSFLNYQPDYSIITNVDYEHLDYYKDFPHLLSTFRNFLNNTKKNGCVFLCADDNNLKQIAKDYQQKKIFFGLSKTADCYAKNIQFTGLNSHFDCFYKGKLLDNFHLALAGVHNISNSLATIALAYELKIAQEIVKRALYTYQGTQRRLQVKAEAKKILLLDDYAHHPTEIKASLKAIANLKHRRIIAVFQPHRYTRTSLLADEFAKSFTLVDEVILTDIYPAGEKPIAGVSARSIYEKLKIMKKPKATFLPKGEIVGYLMKTLRPGDVMITLGAGDIYKIHDELAQRF